MTFINLWFIFFFIVLPLVGYLNERDMDQAEASSREREATLDRTLNRNANAVKHRPPETPEEWKRYEEAKRLLKRDGYIT